MSIDTHHYVGFYLKCSGDKKTDKSLLVDDESIWKISCESGNKLFEQYDFYIPNTKRDLCYHLDKHSNTGTLKVGKIELFPTWLEYYFDKLENYYEKVEAEYGIITYER